MNISSKLGKEAEKWAKGRHHVLIIFIVLGAALGIALGRAYGDWQTWLAIGSSTGLVFGYAFDKTVKK